MYIVSVYSRVVSVTKCYEGKNIVVWEDIRSGEEKNQRGLMWQETEPGGRMGAGQEKVRSRCQTEGTAYTLVGLFKDK